MVVDGKADVEGHPQALEEDHPERVSGPDVEGHRPNLAAREAGKIPDEPLELPDGDTGQEDRSLGAG